MRKWNSGASKRIAGVSGKDSVEAGIPTLVEDLLNGINCPPTDLDQLMRKLGVVGFKYDNNLIVPGELRRVGDALEIYLIPGLSVGRERFTIAHELGHAIVESSGKRAPRQGKELERLCDKMAAEILMPTKVFKRLAGSDPDLDDLINLASRFRTSLSATFKRAVELYDLRAFGVTDGAITWTAGVSRKKLAVTNSVFVKGIDCAMRGEPGADSLQLHVGRGFSEWSIEWCSLKSQRQAIFLLAPHK